MASFDGSVFAKGSAATLNDGTKFVVDGNKGIDDVFAIDVPDDTVAERLSMIVTKASLLGAIQCVDRNATANVALVAAGSILTLA